MPSIDWEAVQAETANVLSEFIQFDTSNPPGNETPLAKHIATRLQDAGYEPQVLEFAPGRGNVVTRYEGQSKAPPILLMAHLDTVPVKPERWEHPPFGGEIIDGYIWGRGALDTKSLVAMETMVMLLLARHRPELARDVIFAGMADEEKDGQGAQFLAREHPDLIRAEYAINERGAQTEWINGIPFYPIQVAEKGVCWLHVRANGQPGHASVPHKNNAVVRLAKAVRRLDKQGTPYHLTDAVRGYARGLGYGLPGLVGLLMPLMIRPVVGPVLRRWLLPQRFADRIAALLCNTATPTGLKAGMKTNVIPSEAELTIDGRTLPGFDPDTFVAELRAVMGDDLEYDVFNEGAPVEVPDYDTPLFELMVKKLRELHPGSHPIPYIVSGATDAKYVSPLGMKVYGFSPMRIAEGDDVFSTVHGHNERIPVDALGFGVRAIYEVIVEFCSGHK